MRLAWTETVRPVWDKELIVHLHNWDEAFSWISTKLSLVTLPLMIGQPNYFSRNNDSSIWGMDANSSNKEELVFVEHQKVDLL